MTHHEKREFLIQQLLSECPQYSDIEIPKNEDEQKTLLRSLMNIRAPRPIDEKFLKIQDEYLREEAADKGAALRREAAIKRLTRTQKLRLIGPIA